MGSHSQGGDAKPGSSAGFVTDYSGLTTVCLCSDSGSTGADTEAKPKEGVPAARNSDLR